MGSEYSYFGKACTNIYGGWKRMTNTNPTTVIQSSAPYDVRPMRRDTKRNVVGEKCNRNGIRCMRRLLIRVLLSVV